jgi:hypothetical protein
MPQLYGRKGAMLMDGIATQGVGANIIVIP